MLNNTKLINSVHFCSPSNGASVKDTNDSGDIFTVEYTEVGNFIWRCTVTDNDGLTGSDDSTQIVKNPQGLKMLHTLCFSIFMN